MAQTHEGKAQTHEGFDVAPADGLAEMDGVRAWQDGDMADSWASVTAADVRAGDRIRLASGVEMLVSRIETRFLGRDGLIAFIEDTPARWYKQPVSQATEVEVARG
ncbi:MAG TPA: hypothetical protein VMA73_31760 [Streptosporangiaceae bacterium]|nr:hypothetical protein [Streptosporangiaceae bacterium]